MKTMKKIVSCTLVLLLLLMIGNGVFKNQAEAARVAVGTYSGGDGTEEDPFLISDAEDLIEMNLDIGFIYYYELTQDIDLSSTSNWEPIGTYDDQFRSVFDGNGHKITNLTINDAVGVDLGLFGYIGSDAIIKNLGLEDVNIKGHSYVGGLASFSAGTIQNSYVTGSISGKSAVGEVEVIGGLVAYNSYGVSVIVM